MDNPSPNLGVTETSTNDSSLNVSKASNDPLTFLTEILKENNIGKLPIYVQNMLKINGFDNIITFCDITEDDLLDMQEFARTDLLDIVGDNPDEKAKYYGLFINSPEFFQFLPGIKKTIFRITDICKSHVGCKQEPNNTSNKKNRRLDEEKVIASQNDNKQCMSKEIIYRNLPLEAAQLTKTVQKYVQSQIKKCDFLKADRKNAILEKLDEINLQVSMDHTDIICDIKCIMCPTKVRVVKKIKKKQVSTIRGRWIMLSFYKHFNTHMTNKNTAGTNKSY